MTEQEKLDLIISKSFRDSTPKSIQGIWMHTHLSSEEIKSVLENNSHLFSYNNGLYELKELE